MSILCLMAYKTFLIGLQLLKQRGSGKVMVETLCCWAPGKIDNGICFRTREANPVGENSSFIFTVCQISSTYHFKLAYIYSSTYGLWL